MIMVMVAVIFIIIMLLLLLLLMMMIIISQHEIHTGYCSVISARFLKEEKLRRARHIR